MNSHSFTKYWTTLSNLDGNSIKCRWDFDFYPKYTWMYKYVASPQIFRIVNLALFEIWKKAILHYIVSLIFLDVHIHRLESSHFVVVSRQNDYKLPRHPLARIVGHNTLVRWSWAPTLCRCGAYYYSALNYNRGRLYRSHCMGNSKALGRGGHVGYFIGIQS